MTNPPGATWSGALAALVALAVLGGCVLPPGATGLSGADARAAGALRGADTAVDPGLARAPEVFGASGVAIWDGSQTVRGRWVAHPAATRSRPVRVVNSATGTEVDAMLYRPQPSRLAGAGDIVTVSSEAAEALGLRPGEPTPLALFALRPVGSAGPQERRITETRAQSELASHVARLPGRELVALAAAAMRGMGYATELGPAGEGALPEIRAFSPPDEGLPLPPTRVLVRPADAAPMTGADLAARQRQLARTGDMGVVVSVSGFAEDAIAGLDPAGARVEMVDLEGLLEIWVTYYERLAGADRELLPLQPVWFFAGAEPAPAAPPVVVRETPGAASAMAVMAVPRDAAERPAWTLAEGDAMPKAVEREQVTQPTPAPAAESVDEPGPALAAEPVDEPESALAAESMDEPEPALAAEPERTPVPQRAKEPEPGALEVALPAAGAAPGVPVPPRAEAAPAVVTAAGVASEPPAAVSGGADAEADADPAGPQRSAASGDADEPAAAPAPAAAAADDSADRWSSNGWSRLAPVAAAGDAGPAASPDSSQVAVEPAPPVAVVRPASPTAVVAPPVVANDTADGTTAAPQPAGPQPASAGSGEGWAWDRSPSQSTFESTVQRGRRTDPTPPGR